MNETNKPHIPWYRSRKFWGIIYFLAFAFSTIIFIQLLDKHGGNYSYTFDQVVIKMNIAYGSTLLFYVGNQLLAGIGGTLGEILYFIIMLFLIYKTLHAKAAVKIIHPIMFILLYLSGMYFSVLLVGSYA